jgi:hypothetical protein
MSDGSNPYSSPKSDPSKPYGKSLLRGFHSWLEGMHKGYLAGAILAVFGAFAGIKKNVEQIQEQHLQPAFAIGIFVVPALVLLLGAFLLYKAINHRP